MKRPVFLIVSLGLNILLGAVIVCSKNRPITRTLSVESGPSRMITARPNDSMIANEPLAILTNEIVAAFNWSEVESTDYQIYLENLRAIGCPEQRIRDIIIADVDALFAGRVRDYVAPLQARFWEFAANARDLEKVMAPHEAVFEKLNRERETLFQALFNETNPRRNWRNELREQAQKQKHESRLDFLAVAKQTAVLALEAELVTTNQSIRNAELTGTREEISQQRAAKVREARASVTERIQALLSPEEYEEYRLRNSHGAIIRRQLARMTLSEAEARSITKAGLDRAESDDSNPAAKSQREQIEQRQIKELLGDSRYAEYQRVADGRYNQIASVIERLQLPEQTSVAVYQARLEAEKIATQLRSDSSASDEERRAALNVVRTEAESSVRQVLGDKAYQDYQNHAGGWFESLSQAEKEKSR